MKTYMGIINLDENEGRINELTRTRPLASVPMAGRYRIIDFILSNMTNSGINNIGIFTKNKSRSLIDHLSNGRPWDLHRKIDGLRVFNFSDDDLYYDDVHIFANNIEFFKFSRQEYVLMAPSYMICNIDFSKISEYHENNNSDVTVVYKKINNGDSSFINCDALSIDEENRVISVGKNIGSNKELNICMEMFLLKKDLFIEIIYDCIKTGKYRKIKKAIYEKLDELKVNAYEFKGYLSCIDSLGSYYKANMDLLNVKINTELFFDNGPIYTKTKDGGPTKYTKDSDVKNSIIANGCYIEGSVENCVISRSVHIRKNAKLKDCIIFQNVIIAEDARLENVLIDKYGHVEKGEVLKGLEKHPLVMEKERVF